MKASSSRRNKGAVGNEGWIRNILGVVLIVVAATWANAAGPGDTGQSVKIALTTSRASVKVGNEVELVLSLGIAKPWFVYGETYADGPGEPLKIDLELPAGVAADGEWQYPDENSPAVLGEDAGKEYVAPVVVKRRLKVVKPLRLATIHVAVSWQACNAQECEAPQTAEFSTTLHVAP